MRLIFVLLFSFASASACCATFPVTPPLIFDDTAVLKWEHPVTRTDGSFLDTLEIVSYKLFFGREDSEALAESVDVGMKTSHTVRDLTPGVWEFGLTTLDIYGFESQVSEIVTKTITAQSRPMAPMLSIREDK